MAFDLLKFLTSLLGAFEVSDIEQKANAWLVAKGAAYPDLAARADALAAWLGTTLNGVDPELDPATMKNTLLGIARDVVANQAGVDPGAWHGGG